MKEATGQEPILSIKEKIYQILRNYYKNYLTNNLGKVVETDDKLICYVKKKKVSKR